MSIAKIKEYSNSINIAADLSEDELMTIGNKVLVGFNEDLQSMAEWLSDVQKIEDLASLQVKKKSTPLPNSANIKLPLITKACYEYASTAYPEIIKDDQVVQGYVLGKDFDGKKAAQALRTTKYMNYQLLYEQQDWQLEHDRLLNRVALVGFLCKKTYYDPIRQIVKSELCDPKELIINADVKSLEDASRITQILHLRLNDFVSAKNKEISGVPIFLAAPVDDLVLQNEKDELDKPIDILEQHCKLDLDKDGYSEPYIVTVTKHDGKVLRIAPRFTETDIYIENGKVCHITPTKCFVDYHFLINPKGKFQSVGFGQLLLHINEASNSVMNQLLDAGQLANMQGGYRDARLKMIPSGNSLHDPGEWKEVKVMTGTDLQQGMVPINYKEPSTVLYQLLSLLIDISRDLTSSAEINNGTQSSQNAKTGATIALQQEGRKTITAINKRHYTSMTNEFRQIFALNGIYLDKKVRKNVIKDVLEVSQADFDVSNVSMFPVADPTLSSASRAMGEVQFIHSVMQLPGVDPLKATKMILTKSNIPDILEILADPNQQQPPNPEVIKLQAEIADKAEKNKLAGHQLELDEKNQIIEALKAEAEIELKKAQAVNQIAQAESVPVANQLEDANLQLAAITKQIDSQMGLAQQSHEKDIQAAEQAHQQQLQQADQAHQQQMTPPEASSAPTDGTGNIS